MKTRPLSVKRLFLLILIGTLFSMTAITPVSYTHLSAGGRAWLGGERGGNRVS